MPAKKPFHPSARASTVASFDQALVCVILGLVAWGLVVVYSASIALPDDPGSPFKNLAPHHFLLRQCISLAVGLLAAWLAFQIPMHLWEHIARALFFCSLLLLLVVLFVPVEGGNKNPARRWLPLGIMQFQPSELSKFTAVLYAADYMVRKMDIRGQFWRAALPMLGVTALACALLLCEPDLGASMVLIVIILGVLFLGGINAHMLGLVASCAAAALALVIWMSPWRRARIVAFFKPWEEASLRGKGLQRAHAMVAAARGGIWGTGLGHGIEKLHWLPEVQTDYLFTTIAEEFGLVGVAVVIAAFSWLTRRLVRIGRQAIRLERVFAGLVAQGVALWIGFQALFHIAVNLGALPTKGLTLPLMSYGGSALMMNLVALAVVLRVDYENRLLLRGKYV